MKKKLILTASLFLLGCDLKDNKVTQSEIGPPIYKSEVEGHIYYTTHYGGLIHSESCTNHSLTNFNVFTHGN